MTSSNNSRDDLRPWWQLLFFGLIFGTFLVLTLLQHGIFHLTYPIEVWVDADAPEPPILAATVHAEKVVESAKLEKRWGTGPIAGFASAPFPSTGIVLIGSPATLRRITRVTLRMATHSEVFDQDQFQKQWTRWEGQPPANAPPGWEGRVFQSPLNQGGSFIARLDQAINYEGDAALARYVLFSPVFLAYAISFVLLLLLRGFVTGRIVADAPALATETTDGKSTPTHVEKGSWLWLLAGVSVLIAAGVLVERQNPYYFSQDDNFAQFLPNIMYGCESLSVGEFPNWNPHQYLGAPLAEIGTYALTYPGTYLSHAIALHVLGDRNATIDVFCWLHLLLGYVVLFWLGRRLGLAAALAAAFSLSQVLSGYALVAGRSWYYMTPVYVWVPLLFISLLYIRTHAPTLRWTMATGLVIGLFFHAGNAQMWCYAMGLAGSFVLWSCVNGSMPWTRLPRIFPAGLVGLGVAAVLLVPQYQATRNLQRQGGEGWDITEGVLAVFVPYPTPLVVDPANQRKLDTPEHFGTMYHAGSVFTIAWLVVLLLVGTRRDTARCFLRDPWLGLAVLTFLLTLGNLGMLWAWQASLPVLDQFNHPHKFLPFFHFFSCAVGAVFTNRAIRRASCPRAWQGGTFLVVSALLLYHAAMTRSAMFVYAEHPYPALPGELSDLRSGAAQPPRIFPLTFNRSRSSDYVVGLQHNFPTVYDISSLGGYDPLIEQGTHYGLILNELRTDTRTTIRKHGVTHLVLHREVATALSRREWASNDWRRLTLWFGGLIADCEHATPVMQTESVRVFEVKDTTPIAYPVNKASCALPVRLVPSGVDVDVSSLTTDHEVVLNYLWRPGIRVHADGTLVPTSADSDQHIRVAVRAGTKNLELRYESPWSTGFLFGGVLVVAGLFGWFAMNLALPPTATEENNLR